MHRAYSSASALANEYLSARVSGAVSVVRITDANLNVSLVQTDRSGQTLSMRDAKNQATAYTYGAFGALTAISRAGTTQVGFQVDAYNRVKATNDAAQGGEQIADYNGFDELIYTRDAAGRVSELFYDELGRIDRMTDADGITDWIYDSDGDEEAENELGRLVETISPSNERTRYSYEQPNVGSNRGLLKSVTRMLVPPGNVSAAPPRALVTTYHYDQYSRVSQVDYPAAGTASFGIKYDFDAGGHPIKISDAAQPGTVYWQLLESYQGYLPKTEQYGVATTTQSEYVATNGKLSSLTTTRVTGGAQLQKFDYTYDPGRRLLTRQDAGGGFERFQHDELDRLRFVYAANGSITRQYDYDSETGRLTFQTGVGNYAYQPTGRDWVESAGSTTYEQDALGNIRTRAGPGVPGGAQVIDYTTFNLPTRVVSGSDPSAAVTEFAYDATGARAVKRSDSQTVYYEGDLYQATVEGGTTVHRYQIFAGAQAIAEVTQPESGGSLGPATVRYLHSDHLGSVRSITDGAGTVTTSRAFEPFGKSSSPVSGSSPYGFTGQEHDDEIGLINMRGRMYDPVLGQFTSADPIVQKPYGHGLNRFSYVFNNPLNSVDPSGFASVATTGFIELGEIVVLGSRGGASSGASISTAPGAALSSSGGGLGGGGSAAVGAGSAGSGITLGQAGSAAGYGLSVAGAFSHVASLGAPGAAQPMNLRPSSSTAIASSQGTPPAGRTSGGLASSPVQERGPPGTSPFDPEAGALAQSTPRPGSNLDILDKATRQIPDTSSTWDAIGEGMAAATAVAPIPGPGKVALLTRLGSWLKRVLGIGKAARGAPTIGKTLNETVGKSAASVVRDVLKGRQPLSALGAEQRAGAAAFYRDVATRTVGSEAAAASRYNIARAEFLEGTRTTLSPTLPEFIKHGF